MSRNGTILSQGSEEAMIGLFFLMMHEKIIVLRTFLGLIQTERIAKEPLRDNVRESSSQMRRL